MLAALCMCVSLAVFYGLCAAVRWPRSHPGATQPVQDSGTIGPCQNPTAPHLLSINASHSSSPSPSHTPPSPSPSSSSSSQTYLLILVFPTERHLNYTPAQSLFYIQFKHSVVLLLSLPPLQSISLSTFFFYSLSSSNGKISYPLCLRWDPAVCGGSELGTTGHSWSKRLLATSVNSFWLWSKPITCSYERCPIYLHVVCPSLSQTFCFQSAKTQFNISTLIPSGCFWYAVGLKWRKNSKNHIPRMFLEEYSGVNTTEAQFTLFVA